jgi:murein DD-endopeptidase MepM/ murein hydrolase activator NlpD
MIRVAASRRAAMGVMLAMAFTSPVKVAAETSESAMPERAVITISKAGDGLGAPIELRSSAKPASTKTAGGVIERPRGMPVAARALTSRVGVRSHPVLGGRRMHSGIDLAAPTGSPVAAPAGGVVSYANWRGGYGLLVTISHGGGLETRFAHLSRIMVSPGQTVSRGQLVGLVGSTGRSTGSHLHYEVRQNGYAVDPLAGH